MTDSNDENKSAPGAALANRLASSTIGSSLDVNIPDSVDDLKNLLIEQENVLAKASVKQGFGFMALKEQLAHGEFEQWISDNGFKQRTVQEKMQAAKFLLTAPEKSHTKLVGLGQKKLSILASIDTDIVAQVIDTQEEFDELISGSYTELRNKVRSLESKSADLTTKLETASIESNDLRNKLKSKNTKSDYPDFVDITRHESAAMSDDIILKMDELERITTELLNIISSTDNTPEFLTFCDIAGASLITHAQMIEARAARLLTMLQNNLPASSQQGINIGQLMLSADEIESAIDIRDELMQEHELAKRIRENEREMLRPRKPGRPKNKDQAK